ncbi:MAG: PLP-dependent aminotransferase family protein, partial [Planctomycetota bacterium]
IQELTSRVITRYGGRAFQYDTTEGFTPLREALSGYLQAQGIKAAPKEILVTSGSQGFLDAISKILINPGDRIAVEAPTYLGALQAFNAYEPAYVQIETDDHGVIPASIDRILGSQTVKFIYLVPTFQNPTGRTIPLSRREEIASIIRKHDALLIEDDPYSALRYSGVAIPTLKSMAPGNVIYVSTFSKIFAPGLRIGFLVAPEELGRWLVLAKQGVDLHTNTFTQALATEYLEGGFLAGHLPKILSLYTPRKEAMLSALDRFFPKGFEWTRPEGGMFVWLRGPEGIDMEQVYIRAVDKGVAYVPGRFFFAKEGDGLATARLNFTFNDEATIERGVKILADVIKPPQRESGR